jgi:RHS repeat-associated protein
VAYYGTTNTNCFVSYDGNGNVAALISAANGSTVANYEYGPFGELIRASGPMAKLNPCRFSTKFDDDETDFIYYGYRYYNPSNGRWINRDPIGEEGFSVCQDNATLNIANRGSDANNLYLLLENNSLDDIDVLGLCGGGGGNSSCGRDVTIDITLTKLNVRRVYQSAPRYKQKLAEDTMFTLVFGAANSWDISWLYINNDFGGDPQNCPDTVTFQNYCVNK